MGVPFLAVLPHFMGRVPLCLLTTSTPLLAIQDMEPPPFSPRFIPGQESASVLQLAKRPKPRAKDVAHRRSLVSMEPFHNMDNSLTALSPEQLATLSRHHSPPFATTATAHRAEENRPDRGGSRLEHSLPNRVEHDQESGLGLTWRPTGPGVFPTGSTPAPVYVGGAGVSPAGSSTASVDFGPFAVVLILEDGSLLNQPTWPTANVQLLRRQVSMTLGVPVDSLFFVCHGVTLDLQRKLSDRPVIDGTTPIFLFTTLGGATQALAPHTGQGPPPSSPGRDGGPPYPRATFGHPPFDLHAQTHDPRLGASSTGGASNKLRSTFKCPKFLGDARHWKQWNKGFVRYLAIQQLDHIIEVEFKTMMMTVALNADNKFVYYLLEDAVSGSAIAAKYVDRAPIWDGHAAYNWLFDGYSFSGPATATLLLSELSNFRFKVDETGTELVLRLQEFFEDLEAVPGQSAIVFSDTQKINYLLSAVKHEKSLQSVYVQIQTDQLRGRITFEQSCDDLRYRCETNRADELLQSRVKGSVKGLMAREEAPYCRIHDHVVAGSQPAPVALITTEGKRQNHTKKAKKESTCLA
jgi:hypothetical protein